MVTQATTSMPFGTAFSATLAGYKLANELKRLFGW
jgi:hypothetical protein